MKHDSDILKRIKKYFMRRKSAREAHAFEREAERDPFLYEAIEGYESMLSSEIQQALDELDDRLEKQAQRRVFIYWKQVAAIAALIAIGTITYNFLDFSWQNRINEENEDATTSQEYAPRQTMPVFEIQDNHDTEYAVEELEKISQTPYIDESLSENPDLLIEPTQEIDSLKKSNAKTIAKTNEEAIKLKDSSLNAKKINPTNLDEDIAIADQEPDRKAINQASSAPAMQENIQQISVSSRQKQVRCASPKIGMLAYNDYLTNNLKKTDVMPSGTVTVSFEFDKNGNPKKIMVDKSLCSSCDAEAIRLIQNGPEWDVTDKKERIQLTVNFE